MNDQDSASAAPAMTRRQIREAQRALERSGDDTAAPVAEAAATSPPLTNPHRVTADEVTVPEPAQLLSESRPAGSRAGRNLPWAIVVGLGLGAVLVLSLVIRLEAFVVLVGVVCALALRELTRAVRTRDIAIPLLPLLVGTAGILICAYTAGVEAMWVAFLLTGGGAFIWRILDGSGPAALRDATVAIFAAAYIPFLAGFVVLMVRSEGGPWLVFAFICMVVANDVGGYAAGVLFGKHPMAPSVSPKKSWEGFGGSLLLASIVGIGFVMIALHWPWWVGLVLGVGTVIAATVGDLAESLLKRDLGVKDMGNLLPGHGGILDRVDSILVAAPFVFVATTVLLGG